MGWPSILYVYIKVKVTVAEERAPSFESTILTAELPENEPIGTFVLALSGESQSTLTYHIINEGMFSPLLSCIVQYGSLKQLTTSSPSFLQLVVTKSFIVIL